jgi:hypothetical protein
MSKEQAVNVKLSEGVEGGKKGKKPVAKKPGCKKEEVELKPETIQGLEGGKKKTVKKTTKKATTKKPVAKKTTKKATTKKPAAKKPATKKSVKLIFTGN